MFESLGNNNSIIDADVSTDEGTKRTVVTLIMNEVFSGVTQKMAKKYNTYLACMCTEELEAAGTSPSDVGYVAVHLNQLLTRCHSSEKDNQWSRSV